MKQIFYKLFFSVLLLFLFIFTNSYSQSNSNDDDLDSKLGKVVNSYANAYLTPFNEALGMNLNTGFFHNAGFPLDKKKPFGLHLFVGLKMMGAFVPESERTFSLTYNETIKAFNGQDVVATYHVKDAPTVLGSKDKPTAKGTYVLNGTTYDAPDKELINGINLSIVPFAMPHFEVGTLYGTDIAFRFMPSIKLGDFGSIAYYGVAVRHNFTSYIKKLPLDLGLQIGLQNLWIKNKSDEKLINVKSFLINVEAAKMVSVFRFFAGIQYENFGTDISYNYTNDDCKKVPVNLTVDGATKIRGILGAGVELGGFRFQLEANYGKYFILSSGIGFGY